MPKETRREGTNLLEIALDVHQSSNGSSDKWFGLELLKQVEFLELAKEKWDWSANPPPSMPFDTAVYELICAAINEGHTALQWQMRRDVA